MASFTELETWKQVRKIRNIISDLVKNFPSEEKFKLADQITRCSRSIGNNIAEDMAVFIIKIISDFALSWLLHNEQIFFDYIMLRY